MNFNDLVPSKSNYLGKPELATPKVVTIASVSHQMLKGDSGMEKKAIVVFNGLPKPLILNKTNAKRIALLYGPETDHWIGKPIEVYYDPNVEFGGDLVGGVRLRQPSGAEESFDGPPIAAFWTLAQACEECKAVGITREELIAHFKAAGLNNYNSERDTEAVKALILSKKQPPAAEEGFDEPPTDEWTDLPETDFQEPPQDAPSGYPENPDADPTPAQEKARKGRKKAS
jgi:hypothetical protein